MYQPLGQRTEIPDSYSYFKLLERNNEPLKDLEEYDVGNKRYVVAVDSNSAVSSFNFPRGSWNPARNSGLRIARTAAMLETGERGFFLISEEGAIHPYAAGEVLAALPARWNPSVQEVALTQDQRALVLSVDGRLLSRNQDGTLTDWAPGEGTLWSDVVNVPLYDSFDVVK
jgi:hypothetical protein